MPNLQEALPLEDLGTFAARALGDPSRFREIADLNGLNPLEALTGGTLLEVPNPEELLAQIEPQLQSVATGVESALQQATTTLEQVRGYTQVARNAVGDVNGILGQVDSQLDQVLGTVRQYQGQAPHLVDWLLDTGRRNLNVETLQAQLQEAINL